MDLLLAHGASAGHINASGRTVLISAALSDDCHPALLKELCTHPAVDVNARCTPRHPRWRLAFALMRYKYRRGKRSNLVVHLAMLTGSSALLCAARRGDAAAVRVLLEAGADVHARNALGLDAVQISQLYGPYPVVEDLLTRQLEVVQTAP